MSFTIPLSSMKKFIFYYAIFISLFHFYQNIFGGLSDLWFNAAHFSLFASLGFLLYRTFGANEDRIHIADIALALLCLFPFLYLVFFEESFYTNEQQIRFFDIVFAVTSIVLAVEMVRRTTGYIIPFLILSSIGYILYFGQFLSGVFAFEGITFNRFVYRVYFTGEGLFGAIATISSTYVFMFILFAAFLIKSGAGDFIVDLARGVTSKFVGGAGHVAVFSSALLGTISGSAVANTVSTGSITINMMKKNKFDPTFAAAVEAAASTGGQIMPPIMGAGIFVMAQMTQIPLSTIILASIFPAILYFASISFYIHIHAKKRNILPQEDKVDIFPILREGFHFFIPLSVLIGLLIYGFTPTYAAGISILAIILSSYLTKTKRMRFVDILEAFSLGAKNMVVTAILLVSIGIVVGIINISGVGVTFSQLIMQWSGDYLIIALILVALASLIIGMGLPPTASYVVIAVLCAPALLGLMISPEMAALVGAGVILPEVTLSLLSAHLIIFWLSQDSNLTPPVCLAAFAAAGIAGTSPMRTGLKAWKLGKGLYIMPVLFAFTPLITGSFFEQLEIFVFALLGLFCFSILMENYWNKALTLVDSFLCVVCVSLCFITDENVSLSIDKILPYVNNTHLLGSVFLLILFRKIR